MDYLKIIIIILMILFLVLSSVYKYSDCAKCKFKIENKTLDYYNFFDYYSDKCFSESEVFNLSLP